MPESNRITPLCCNPTPLWRNALPSDVQTSFDFITRTAQQISATRIDARLPMTGNGDELDRLAQTLNDMLNRLDDSFRRRNKMFANPKPIDSKGPVPG
ncbi:HAMP domain-containing protein [Desulfosarcina variabilis]|uniref:HAMP domain-containing protein n=1 Tax=Desulfosarcina variabilis TaxID=2300 RepID=UPI003AFB251B